MTADRALLDRLVNAHKVHRAVDHDRRSTIDVAPANDVEG